MCVHVSVSYHIRCLYLYLHNLAYKWWQHFYVQLNDTPSRIWTLGLLASLAPSCGLARTKPHMNWICVNWLIKKLMQLEMCRQAMFCLREQEQQKQSLSPKIWHWLHKSFHSERANLLNCNYFSVASIHAQFIPSHVSPTLSKLGLKLRFFETQCESSTFRISLKRNMSKKNKNT